MHFFKRIIISSLIIILLFSQISFCTESFVWDNYTLETSSENTSGNFLNLESAP